MPLRGDRYAAVQACYNCPLMTDAAPTTPAPPPKGALAVVLLIVFIDLLGFGIILPQLPFYAIHFHASPLAVAMLFSIYSACQFAAAPILGVISDRVGRKPVLAFSQLGSAAGYLLLGVTTQLHFDNVTMALGLVYLARIIDGVTGGNISTAQAYISDVTTPATRARGMGLFGAMFGIGFAVGPVLGLVGNDTNRAAWPAYLAALLSLTAAALSVLRLPESRAAAPVSDEVWLHPGRLLPLFRRPTLGPLLLVTFATMAAFTMLEGTIGLFLHDRFRRHSDGQPFGMHELSWYFAYIGVIITVVQGGVVSRAIGRFGEWPVGIVGAAAVAVAMSLYVGVGYHPALPLLLVAGAVNALGRSLQGPPISSLISKVSGRGEQGTVFGVYHGLGSLARVIGPAVAGAAYQHLSGVAPFVIACSMMVLVTAWLTILWQTRPATPVQPRGSEPVMTSPIAEAEVEVAQAPS